MARAMLLNGDPSRAGVLIVADSEGQGPGYVERPIHMHFRGGGIPTLDRVRVAVVEPRHEAWLCIGLGIDRGTYRVGPEAPLVRSRGVRVYEKRFPALCRGAAAAIPRLPRAGHFYLLSTG